MTTKPAGTAQRDVVELYVRDVRELCPGVRQLVLTHPAGAALPSFVPGSNISIEWAPGRWNSYSLTGPSLEPDHYAISVRRDNNGQGGSRWVHELGSGDVVTVSTPVSAFAPVLTARHHILVAGGIGITPILSHVRAALEWDRSFEVLYTFRSGSGAHVEELLDMCADRTSIVHSAQALRAALESALSDRPLGSHLYSCGPLPMIDTVQQLAQQAGWHGQRVHSEAFGVGPLDAGQPFAAKLGRSGMLVPVPSGVSLLEALLSKGIEVPNLCRQGVCGECKLPVRGGSIDHRDLYLTDDDKAAGDCIMPCVSRAAGDLVELDL
uniref:PDR/VanB family oxidoreductase n=1 Tax=Rhodococcus qingshengii TaxID=334542 RepID=UPI003555E938